MEKLALFVKTRTKPGKRDEVKRLWEEHLQGRLEAPDSLQDLYLFCFDDEDEDVFILCELYRSRDAYQENARAPWFWAYMEAVGPLIEGQPEVWTTTPVYTRGV